MYIGPEVIMPLASAVAAAAGFLLMFWRRVVTFARAIGTTVNRTVARLFASH